MRPSSESLPDLSPAPPAIFNGASRRRIEVDAVGLCRDGDQLGGLLLAPRRVGLVM
jgi:hypothetical protein